MVRALQRGEHGATKGDKKSQRQQAFYFLIAVLEVAVVAGASFNFKLLNW